MLIASCLGPLHASARTASFIGRLTQFAGIPAIAPGEPALLADMPAADVLTPRFPKRLRTIEHPATPDREREDLPQLLDLPKLSWGALLSGLLGMLKGEAGHPKEQVMGHAPSTMSANNSDCWGLRVKCDGCSSCYGRACLRLWTGAGVSNP